MGKALAGAMKAADAYHKGLYMYFYAIFDCFLRRMAAHLAWCKLISFIVSLMRYLVTQLYEGDPSVVAVINSIFFSTIPEFKNKTYLFKTYMAIYFDSFSKNANL